MAILFSENKKNNLTKIIQVGANEGTKSDYLNNVLKTYGENISVLFIEPQLNLKNVLIKNTKSLCKKTDYAFVAINSNKLSSLELFIPNQSIFPNTTTIASFDKNQIIKRLRKFHGIKKPVLNKHYFPEIVPQKTLSEVAKEWNNYEGKDKICDVLVVDTEGYDDQVIYSIDNPKNLPKIISFEWKNLTHQKFINLKIFLEDNQFKVFKWSKADAIAIKNN